MCAPTSAQEEAEFREYAARPDVLDLIPRRIAPQIFGSERIKEAVACLLFGGSRKVRCPCDWHDARQQSPLAAVGPVLACFGKTPHDMHYT